MVTCYVTSEMKRSEFVLKEIYAGPRKRKDATSKTNVYHIDDTWRRALLDLNDNEPTFNKNCR